MSIVICGWFYLSFAAVLLTLGLQKMHAEEMRRTGKSFVETYGSVFPGVVGVNFLAAGLVNGLFVLLPMASGQ